MSEPDYYQNSPKGGLIEGWTRRQRAAMVALFLERFQPSEPHTILDVGVTSDEAWETSNYLELAYPHKHRVTAAGLDPQSPLPRRYPGLQYVQIKPGPLPFPDRSFDFVWSNAVVEHVGGREEQRKFLAELWRVARLGAFATTPNRWFPAETHTGLPLVHWLPARAFRACLKALGKDFYSKEENLNLLSRGELKRLCGWPGAEVRGLSLFGFDSNLCLFAQKLS